MPSLYGFVLHKLALITSHLMGNPVTLTSGGLNAPLPFVAPGGWAAAFQPARGSTQDPRIIDISIGLDSNTVGWQSTTGLGPQLRTLVASQAAGDAFTASELHLSAHAGTHVDAPGHFVWSAYSSGRGVESLSLQALNGPALVIETPAHSNISAAMLEALSIPQGTTRLLFKTANTARRLLDKKEFDSSYTAFTRDGADWLIRHAPWVRLVGIDYLSVAVYDDLVGPHVLLLGTGRVVVEGLSLRGVAPGLYQLHCLPLKVKGADGAPARCILIA